jgi:hypothetical protein
MKTFKFSIAIIVLALFFSKSFVQASTLINGAINTQSGIYLTASDFNHNSLDLSGDKSIKNTFRLNDFFGREKITVNHDGKKYQFSKDSIFGYRDKDGIVYRFFKDYTGEYKIVENKKAVIYERRFPNGKAGFKTVYYFSNGAKGDIYVLSIDNLKKVFNGEPSFDVIDINFHTDGDLLSYDQTHHEFRINYYLSKIDPA